VSASDGSGTGGPGAVPGVILGAGFSYTTRNETGELLTVIYNCGKRLYISPQTKDYFLF